MSPNAAAEPNKRDEADESPEDKPKKQKFSRSRTACLQCRSRKSRCGALPPDRCPNCAEAGLTCQWPVEDGRSSKARMLRAKGTSGDVHLPPSTADVHLHRPDEAPGGAVANANANGLDANQWLGSLLSAPLPAHSQPPHRMFPSDFDPSLPGPSNYASYAPPFASTPAAPDPLMWAMSSRLPVVEETSPPNPAGESNGDGEGKGGADKVVKISWFRPHGQTAYAPGLKRITLKVRIDTPEEALQRMSPRVPLGNAAAGGAGGVNGVGGGGDGVQPVQLLSPDGAPDPTIMRHLLDVFMVYFGCQFPFIDRADMEKKIEARSGNVFLLNCIAGIAARFSNHPSIALPELEPWAYGNVFYHRAKAMLGSMLSVPSREAVQGFVLLAHIAFANDVESEIWMLTGMAVRMALDMGLHLLASPDSEYSPEERRLNRLLCYSVIIMDYTLAFGVGRQTAWRVEDITQQLPSQEEDACGAVFPYAAKMMLSYGPIINMLNREQQGGDPAAREAEINEARLGAIRLYNQLPQEMQWNVGNLQRHCKTNQGPIFVHMHLWMHTILASGFLVHRSGTSTPTSLWRNSARTIGDILVLADIISPASYLALPFAVQPFYVASCCYVKEIEESHLLDGTVDLSRALLTSVATTNISTLQSGLSKQAMYWSGVRWILGTLEKRIEGFQDVDLGGVTEKLKSLISLPDAGLVKREGDGKGGEDSGMMEIARAAIVAGAAGAGGGAGAGGEAMMAMGSESGTSASDVGHHQTAAGAGGAYAVSLGHLSHTHAQHPGAGADAGRDLDLAPGMYAMSGLAASASGVNGGGGGGGGTGGGGLANGEGVGVDIGAVAGINMPPYASATPQHYQTPSHPSMYDFLNIPFDLGDPEGQQTVTDMPADAWQMDWFK